MKAEAHERVFGIVAEFESGAALLRAARATYDRGFRDMDAYTPYPVEGLAKAIGYGKNRVAPICLMGGVVGGLGGYFMQWYAMAVDYPLNVGGRPLHSIASFVPITFELTILCGGISALVAMLVLSGLPRPYHPIFDARHFERASTNGFFLCIEASDPSFEREFVTKFLRDLGSLEVSEVHAP